MSVHSADQTSADILAIYRIDDSSINLVGKNRDYRAELQQLGLILFDDLRYISG
ncbi:hypothetical protein LOC67_21720 [Stieleria sp. JC731]|uniref:hypothetical protein n=1 Tax=Pirellulaceae TaxID=2691357 RepID=UPI001E459FFA|nr:hypothetical protein [Stieleria sp. JC731]MCC9603177.1 hypothetical protein [Stieleria sp. JC731]